MPSPASSAGTAAVVENLLKHKWSRTILGRLREGIADPVRIAQMDFEIAPSTMSERLRTMVRYALIQRSTRHPRAKTVHYHLTPRGRRILTVLDLVNRLDAVPDTDPRPLEEIFYLDLHARIAPPVMLSDDPPAGNPAAADGRNKNPNSLAV